MGLELALGMAAGSGMVSPPEAAWHMLPRSGMLLSPVCWSDPCRVRSADRFLLGTATGPLWVSLAACCQPAAPRGSPRGHTWLMALFDPSKLAFGGRAQSEPSAGCVRAPFSWCWSFSPSAAADAALQLPGSGRFHLASPATAFEFPGSLFPVLLNLGLLLELSKAR